MASLVIGKAPTKFEPNQKIQIKSISDFGRELLKSKSVWQEVDTFSSIWLGFIFSVVCNSNKLWWFNFILFSYSTQSIGSIRKPRGYFFKILWKKGDFQPI
uniref:(northern house mosquito) hypothetical protein n=1 Tax=Culex pipiens TaxID=7175 RepID=A0A8D8PD04_CULPI